MKAISNSRFFRLFIFVALLTASSFIVLSPDVSAITSRNQTPESAATGAFCTNLSSKTNQVITKIDSLSAKLSEAWSLQSKKSLSQFQQVDEKVKSSRSKADEARSGNFKKLEEKASSEKEKTAVQAYKLAVNSAIDVRRTAYDDARSQFRANLQSMINSRKNITTSELDAYKISINNAIVDAKNGCMSDSVSSALEVRKAFQDTMKNAQIVYRNSRLNDDKVKADVSSLVAVRNDTYKAADQIFKDSMDMARKDLISAFGPKADI